MISCGFTVEIFVLLLVYTKLLTNALLLLKFMIFFSLNGFLGLQSHFQPHGWFLWQCLHFRMLKITASRAVKRDTETIFRISTVDNFVEISKVFVCNWFSEQKGCKNNPFSARPESTDLIFMNFYSMLFSSDWPFTFAAKLWKRNKSPR